MGVRLQSITVMVPDPRTMAEPSVSLSMAPTGGDTELTGTYNVDQRLIDAVIVAVVALRRAIDRA